jgi:dihydroorotase
VKRLVRGGRLVDPSQGLDGRLDLLVEDGVVSRIGEGLEASGAEITEAEGLVVCPGFIDLNVHLREPGEEYKETVRTGLMAAAAGGFTAVVAMPDSSTPNDERAVTELLVGAAARYPYARLYPAGAVSRGLVGEGLAEIGEMVAAGAVALSDDACSIAHGGLLRRALQYAQHYGVPVIQRPEDGDLADGGVMHEGEWSTRLGLPGVPGLAEAVQLARDLFLAEEVGGRYHAAHLSTAQSLELVRRSRELGVAVTCDVTPHHLVLEDKAVAETGFSPNARLVPPLRSAADREALLAGLADGTIDAIASDHSPHHADAKEVQLSIAPPGIVGLETTVSLCLDRLVHGGVIPLPRLVELLSTGPARALGLPGGSLAEGRPADITLLDLERPVTIDPSTFRSLARNTLFGGWRLRGAAVGTLLAGRPVELPS